MHLLTDINVRQREKLGFENRNVARWNQKEDSDSVLKSDDVEVAMVTGGRGEGRRGEMAAPQNYLAVSLLSKCFLCASAYVKTYNIIRNFFL